MPAYSERLVKQVYRPPFRSKNVSAHAFIVRGDSAKIQSEIINPTLGPGFAPAGGNFTGLGDLFVVAWLTYKDGFSSDPPKSTVGSAFNPDYYRGSFVYRESAVFHLVESKETNKTYFYIPSLFLDKSVPILTGRDVYGMPKTSGVLRVPASPGTLSTHADVIQNYQSPPNGAPFDITPNPAHSLIYKAWPRWCLLRRPPTESVQPDDRNPVGTVDAAVRAFRDSVRANVSRSGLRDLVAESVLELFREFCLLGGGSFDPKVLFLKQLPSSEQPGQASFRTFVVSGFETTNISLLVNYLPVLPWSWKVQFMDWDSAPFARSFGVPTTPIFPLMSFHIELDLDMPMGNEISNP